MKLFGRSGSREDVWKQYAGRLARSRDFTVFDCEMTGLDARKDELIAIGAVRVREGRILLEERFYRLIRPSEQMARENVLIHRLSHDQVDRGEAAEEAVRAFNAFVGQSALVAHFSRLDQAFLNKVMRRHRIKPALINPVFDTANLYRWYLRRQDPHHPPEPGALALATICERLGVPIYREHHAFYDALTTACLFLKILGLAEAARVFTFGDLKRIARERWTDAP